MQYMIHIADKCGLKQTQVVYIILDCLYVNHEQIDSTQHEPAFVTPKAARAYANEYHKAKGELTWNDDAEYEPGRYGFIAFEDDKGIVNWEIVIREVPLFDVGQG